MHQLMFAQVSRRVIEKVMQAERGVRKVLQMSARPGQEVTVIGVVFLQRRLRQLQIATLARCMAREVQLQSLASYRTNKTETGPDQVLFEEKVHCRRIAAPSAPSSESAAQKPEHQSSPLPVLLLKSGMIVLIDKQWLSVSRTFLLMRHDSR